MCNKVALLRSVRVVLVLVLAPCIGWGQQVSSYAEIEANRQALIEWQSEEERDVDFYIDSAPIEGGIGTTVALIVDDLDLEDAGSALDGPAAWCQFLFLHLNVKTCVHGENDEGRWIRMYMGKKSYQTPKKAEEIELQFNSGVTGDGVNWVNLTADEGPYGTSDYFVGLSAIPAENGTYAQLRSSQKASGVATGAMNFYYKTLARDKIGFSVVGTDKKGNTKYSTGAQAMLERNVVRYLLAIDVYMQSPADAGTDAFLERAAMWFDETERYPEQLHEVDRDDYLKNKKKEYKNMLEMQAEIDAAATAD